MILSNIVDSIFYVFVFVGEKVGNVKLDFIKVFVFFEDFFNLKLNQWIWVWGEWIVQNGIVFGKMGMLVFGYVEVGLFLDEGRDWEDIELEFDLMEIGLGVVYFGLFL